MNYTYQQGLDSENMTELCNSPLIIKAVLHLKWWLVNHFRGVWIRVLCQTGLIVNSSKYIMIGNLLLIVMLPDVCLLTCTLDLYVVMPTLWSNKPVLSNREKLIIVFSFTQICGRILQCFSTLRGRYACVKELASYWQHVPKESRPWRPPRAS